MKYLPVLVMEKLLKEAGAKRVSEEAKAELQRALSAKIFQVTKEAVDLARHAGRKTVKKEDVLLALGR